MGWFGKGLVGFVLEGSFVVGKVGFQVVENLFGVVIFCGDLFFLIGLQGSDGFVLGIDLFWCQFYDFVIRSCFYVGMIGMFEFCLGGGEFYGLFCVVMGIEYFFLFG